MTRLIRLAPSFWIKNLEVQVQQQPCLMGDETLVTHHSDTNAEMKMDHNGFILFSFKLIHSSGISFTIKLAGALIRSERGQQGSYPCGLDGRLSICWTLSILRFCYSMPLRTNLRQLVNCSTYNSIKYVTEFIKDEVVDSFVKSRNRS